MADDPLKLILELDAQIQNLLGVAKKLGQLEGAGHKADAALKDLAKSSEKTEAAVGHLGSGIGQFVAATAAHFAALVAEKGLEFIVEKTVDIGKEMVKTIAETRNLERGFHTLFKPDEAKEFEDWLEQIKDHTRFDDDDIKKFALGLKRAGVEAKSIPDMVRGGLDLAELTGGDPKAALDSVGQFFEGIATRGEVAFKQLGAVGITKPELLKSLSEQTGDTIDDVEKKLTAGKIKIDRLQSTIFSLITKHTGKGLGDVGAEGGEGIDAQIDRLKRQPQEWFKALAENPAIDRIAAQIGNLAKIISPEGPVGSKVVDGLTGLLDKIGAALEGIDVEDVFQQISYWVGVAVDAFKILMAVGKGFFTFLELLGEGIGTTFGAIYMAISDLLDGFRYIGESIADFVFGIIKSVGGALTAVGEFAGKVWNAAVDLGSKIWQGLKDGIMGGITAVTDAMGSLVSGVLGKVTGMLGIHSPSRVMMEMGEQTGEGYARGLAGTHDRIDAVVGETMQVDATPQSSARGPGGGVVVNVPITVNWSGGAGGDQEAQALAERIRDLIPGQLASALEQLGLEMGAA